MTGHRAYPWLLAAALGLGGCATAPVNPPITHADPTAGYRFETRDRIAMLNGWMADVKTGERLTFIHKPGTGL